MFQQHKDFRKCIDVSTDLFRMGIDIERVNALINHDMPDDRNSYLQRVGRTVRLGTKDLAINLASTDEDWKLWSSTKSRSS